MMQVIHQNKKKLLQNDVERLLMICDHLQDNDYMIRECRPRTQAMRRRKANAGDLIAGQARRNIRTAYKGLDELGQVLHSFIGNTIDLS